jgi:hypothetical protein
VRHVRKEERNYASDLLRLFSLQQNALPSNSESGIEVREIYGAGDPD